MAQLPTVGAGTKTEIQKTENQKTENQKTGIAKHGSATTGTAAVDPASAGTCQLLTFTLATEAFAIPIEHVREIIEFHGLTSIPLMPDFLRGVINLRGAVVPVVDLQSRFGRGSTAIHKRTCVVIVELEQEDGAPSIGVMVDAVNEVLTVDRQRIEPRPSFGANIRADFIDGILNLDNRFVITLDIRQVLSVDEMAALIGATERAEPSRVLASATS